jgi:hypothetical protein
MNRRIRENQAGRSAGRHAVAPGRHAVPRPAAREAPQRPHTGAPERSGRTVGVTSGTPASISWHCGALAALFPLVHFGGTRPSRIHAAGGNRRNRLAAASLRIQRGAARLENPCPNRWRGRHCYELRPGRPLGGGGKGYNSSRVRFTGQRSQTASHTPRRASSAPAGAAAAPGFSGSPEKPRPLKYMQDGCGS